MSSLESSHSEGEKIEVAKSEPPQGNPEIKRAYNEAGAEAIRTLLGKFEGQENPDQLMKDFEHTWRIVIGRPDQSAKGRIDQTPDLPAYIKEVEEKKEYRKGLIMKLMNSRSVSDPAVIQKLLDQAEMEAHHAFNQPNEGWRLQTQQTTLEGYVKNPIYTGNADIVRLVLQGSEKLPSTSDAQRIKRLLEPYISAPDSVKTELLKYIDKEMQEASLHAKEVQQVAQAKMLPDDQKKAAFEKYEKTFQELDSLRKNIGELLDEYRKRK